jgi:hypothetical protein
MPNTRLHLIFCSDDVEHEVGHQRRDRSFQRSVIDGGKQTASVLADNPWIDLLDVFDLGVVVCQASYLAFLHASLAALESQVDGPDPGSLPA